MVMEINMMNKHDGYRIGIVDNHNAIIYHKDGTMINLTSDNDIRRLIEIVCSPIECECTWTECLHGVEDTQTIERDVV